GTRVGPAPPRRTFAFPFVPRAGRDRTRLSRFEGGSHDRPDHATGRGAAPTARRSPLARPSTGARRYASRLALAGSTPGEPRHASAPGRRVATGGAAPVGPAGWDVSSPAPEAIASQALADPDRADRRGRRGGRGPGRHQEEGRGQARGGPPPQRGSPDVAGRLLDAVVRRAPT